MKKRARETGLQWEQKLKARSECGNITSQEFAKKREKKKKCLEGLDSPWDLEESV